MRLSERVWCTKIFSFNSLKVTSISVSSSTRSYLFISATVPKRQKVFTSQDWHKTYPVCKAPLSISGQRSFTSSQNSLRHNRSCEWTEALSGKIFVAARKLSGIVRTQPYRDNRTGEIRKLATEILCWRWRTINNRNGEEKVVAQLSLRSLRSLKSGFHIIAMIAAIAEPFFSQRSQRSYGNQA